MRLRGRLYKDAYEVVSILTKVEIPPEQGVRVVCLLCACCVRVVCIVCACCAPALFRLNGFRSVSLAFYLIDSFAQRMRTGIVHVGACAPGMNTAVRAVARIAINHGHSVLGIRNGVDGLLQGDVEPLHWMSVNGWARLGVRTPARTHTRIAPTHTRTRRQ